jgi:tyrosyl-tRNA synthetase
MMDTMLPTFTIPSRKISIVDLCVFVGFAKSKSAARRLIEQGGIRINDVKVTDPNLILQWPEKE